MKCRDSGVAFPLKTHKHNHTHTGHDGKRERAAEEGEGEKDRKGRLVLEDSNDHD